MSATFGHQGAIAAGGICVCSSPNLPRNFLHAREFTRSWIRLSYTAKAILVENVASNLLINKICTERAWGFPEFWNTCFSKTISFKILLFTVHPISSIKKLLLIVLSTYNENKDCWAWCSKIWKPFHMYEIWWPVPCLENLSENSLEAFSPPHIRDFGRLLKFFVSLLY